MRAVSNIVERQRDVVRTKDGCERRDDVSVLHRFPRRAGRVVAWRAEAACAERLPRGVVGAAADDNDGELALEASDVRQIAPRGVALTQRRVQAPGTVTIMPRCRDATQPPCDQREAAARVYKP